MFLRAIKLDMLEICSRKNKDAIMLKKKKTPLSMLLHL